jgi:hypothetical protein
MRCTADVDTRARPVREGRPRRTPAMTTARTSDFHLTLTLTADRGTHVAYISPYKLAHLEDDGAFYLKWYPANDATKGTPLPTTPDPAAPNYLAAKADVSAGALLDVVRLGLTWLDLAWRGLV